MLILCDLLHPRIFFPKYAFISNIARKFLLHGGKVDVLAAQGQGGRGAISGGLRPWTCQWEPRCGGS
jgi:hypothetical protein